MSVSVARAASNAWCDCLRLSTCSRNVAIVSSFGNDFRYDPGDGQYIYNLSTKGLEPGTYELRVDLGDGKFHTVQIALKK